MTTLVGWIGGSMIVVAAVAIGALSVADPESFFRRAFRDYEQRLAGRVAYLFLPISAPHIARGQLVAGGLCVALLFVTGKPIFLGLVAAVVLAPALVLRRLQQKRAESLEKQLDTWLLAVANALRASGSIGEAIESSSAMVPPPMSQEVDLIVKEMRLGTPLANAVRSAARRIGSRTVTSGLSTIIVGQQTGGDVPKILEETAAALRETARLEAVHRSKTSQSKWQVMFMAAMPFFTAGALYMLDEESLDPLTATAIGNIITAIAAVCWISSLLLARKILTFES